MALQDHPILHEEFKKLQAEKDKIVEKVAPLRRRYNELQALLTPLEVEQRELITKIHSIERPRLSEIDMQMSAIAQVTGGNVIDATLSA